MLWHREEHLSRPCHLQGLLLWPRPTQEVEEVEEVPKWMVVRSWVVVVEVQLVTNVVWELK